MQNTPICSINNTDNVENNNTLILLIKWLKLHIKLVFKALSIAALYFLRHFASGLPPHIAHLELVLRSSIEVDCRVAVTSHNIHDIPTEQAVMLRN